MMDGQVTQVVLFVKCVESGQADMERREEKKSAHCSRLHSFTHYHIMSHRTNCVCILFVCFYISSTRHSPTCLCPALIRAVGSVNRVVTTHWNKASATLANLNLSLVHKRYVRCNYDSSGVSTITHSQAESVCVHVCVYVCVCVMLF